MAEQEKEILKEQSTAETTEEEKTSEWYYQKYDWKSLKSLSDEYNRIKSIFK